MAHCPSCYDANVDTKDVLNDEVYMYSAALVGSRAVVYAFYIVTLEYSTFVLSANTRGQSTASFTLSPPSPLPVPRSW